MVERMSSTDASTTSGASIPSVGSEDQQTSSGPRHLTLPRIAELLYEAGLLREVILPAQDPNEGEPSHWLLDPASLPNTAFTHLTYDTRQAQPGSLLFVKGRFREEFFAPALEAGLAGYVAERPYDLATGSQEGAGGDPSSALTTPIPAIIVTDALAAMSLLAAEFYGHPERELTVVGLTGTKGKTTTAHLMHAVLARATQGRAAMFSSNHLCLDGHSFEPATLTTPESLDTFRMMRQARDNGMTHLVMEVSSQAYKVGRVWGLHFDVAVFLNISPDHISDIEHPTFEDYFFCKRQLLRHADAVVLNAGSDYAELLATEARMAGASLTTYGWQIPDADRPSVDLELSSSPDGFTVREHGTVLVDSENHPIYLNLAGRFNEENAAAAIAVARVLGVDDEEALRAVEEVVVSGRMERISVPFLTAYIDFAHNYLSTSALLDEVDREFEGRPTWRLLVSGSTGGKAVNRREGIVTAANGRVDAFLFTEDDQDEESATDIGAQMMSYIEGKVPTRIVPDRTQAIESAVQWASQNAVMGGREAVILLIGKGDQNYNVVDGTKVPYETDSVVLRRALELDD